MMTTSENQAFGSVQPSGLTDGSPPSPDGAVSNHFGRTGLARNALNLASQAAGLISWAELSRTSNPMARASILAHAELIASSEATEARHAAVLRELKERFSEVAGRAVKHMARTCFAKGSPCQLEREAVVEGLTDFIIPAPDPLVEAAEDAFAQRAKELGVVLTGRPHVEQEWADKFRAAMRARGYELRKIGEAGE